MREGDEGRGGRGSEGGGGGTRRQGVREWEGKEDFCVINNFSIPNYKMQNQLEYFRFRMQIFTIYTNFILLNVKFISYIFITQLKEKILLWLN